MKKLIIALLLLGGIQMNAQDNSAMLKHFEAYYKQMKAQGDTQGIINALTHLNVMQPSEARKDTLAYIYMSDGNYMQALNTIGYEKLPADSDIAVQVKAISLKALNQPKLALGQFEEMYKRNPNPSIAYELADLNIQTKNLDEAKKYIDMGAANVKPEMKHAYYETQQPYQVSLKAAFMYLDALYTYNKDKKANLDKAIDLLDSALKTAPNFNLVQITKQEMLRQKQALQAQAEQAANSGN
ncbi:hypothetical protein [Gaetbulibacter aestuarii]|uniref:Tetratricopeptide repeat protein n=1 Tax=Gaetbulibacter aestuarii TaxID=1502358 RepID=A0ABW7MU48_9FLAO